MRHWLVWPREIRLWGGALLHQQCWCWGQDVRRAEGNLLMEYGFARRRPPEGCKGSTAYFQEDACGALALWGFGIFFGQGECGLHLGRYGWAPRLKECAQVPRDVWKPEQLQEFRVARTPEQCEATLILLESALHRIAAYESWVLETQGALYRRDVLQQWPHAVSGAQSIARDWELLAVQLRRRALRRQRLC
jgi:hypothetical protein